jgi:hypothetical protein
MYDVRRVNHKAKKRLAKYAAVCEDKRCISQLHCISTPKNMRVRKVYKAMKLVS